MSLKKRSVSTLESESTLMPIVSPPQLCPLFIDFRMAKASAIAHPLSLARPLLSCREGFGLQLVNGEFAAGGNLRTEGSLDLVYRTCVRVLEQTPPPPVLHKQMCVTPWVPCEVSYCPLGLHLVLRSGYEWRGCPQAVSRRSHRTRNKNKQTKCVLHSMP
jgi:hypothetical protein